MQKTIVGYLNDQEITFYQCDTLEEAQKAGLPQGVFFYWEIDGARIYSPGELVNLVVLGAPTGVFQQAQHYMNPKALQDYYRALYDAQRNMILTEFKKLEEAYTQDITIPEDVRKAMQTQIETTRQFYEKHMPFPDIDGLYKPTKEEAERIVGGAEQLDTVMPPEVQREFFNSDFVRNRTPLKPEHSE